MIARRSWVAVFLVILCSATAPAISAPAPQDELETARRLAASGSTGEALDATRRALADSPSFEGRLLESSLLIRLGQDDEARRALEQMVAETPLEPEIYNNLAALAARAGKPEEAVEILERAVRVDPVYAVIFENLRLLYATLASRAYNRALELGGGESGSVSLHLLDGSAPQIPPTRPVFSQTADGSGYVVVMEPLATSDAGEPADAAAQVARADSEPSGRAAGAPPATGSDSAEPLPTAPEPLPAAEEAVAESPSREERAAGETVDSEEVEDEIHTVITSWADAWSAQDVDRYLSFYSSGYRRNDRASWEAQRRARLTSPGFIRVSLVSIRIELAGEDRASARFLQRYRSDRFQDVVTKTLQLEREEGSWKIVDEQSD